MVKNWVTAGLSNLKCRTSESLSSTTGHLNLQEQYVICNLSKSIWPGNFASFPFPPLMHD